MFSNCQEVTLLDCDFWKLSEGSGPLIDEVCVEIYQVQVHLCVHYRSLIVGR